MKRCQLLGLALMVVCVLGAVIDSTAGAVEFLLAEWLAAGAKITTAQGSEGEGELELVAKNGGNLKVELKVLCSVILDGTLGPSSEGTISEFLSLSGKAISDLALSGGELACTNDANCTSPKVWATGLPWKTELELMIDGTETFFVNLIKSFAGYYVECTVLGVKVAEECTTFETAIKTTNAVGGIAEQGFSDVFQELAGLKLADCSLGGGAAGEVNGAVMLLLFSGGLTASSE